MRGKALTVRPLSKAEAEEFQSGSPNVVTPPPATSQRPQVPHIPVSPPRMGPAAAKPAAAPQVQAAAPQKQRPEAAVPAAQAVTAQGKAEPASTPAATGAAPAAKAAAAKAAQSGGKVPSGPPSRVLRLANMVRLLPHLY